jgi:hypothetical protein
LKRKRKLIYRFSHGILLWSLLPDVLFDNVV